MLLLLATVIIFIISYIIVAPVRITFRVDSSLSSDMRIELFPFAFKLEKSGRRQKSGQIDLERLFFKEFKAAKRVLYLGCRLFKAFRNSKHCSMNIFLQGGFGSPDITGMIFGAIATVRPVFGKRVTLVYCPDMMADSTNLNLNAQAIFRIYSVLGVALPLAFSLPMLNIARAFIKTKKGGYNVRAT